MTLKKGFILSQRLAKKQKDVRYAGKYGAIVNEVLKTEEGRTNLNQQREITELHNMVQDLAEGGIYKNELRELSDKLAHGHEAKYISHKEGRAIAKVLKEKFYPGLKKYKSSQNDSPKSAGYGTFRSSSKSAEYGTAKTNSIPAATTSTGNTQMTPIVMAKILNKARDNFASSLKNEDGEQKGSNFSKALKSMEEHKHS
jgi:hypothetical protein